MNLYPVPHSVLGVLCALSHVGTYFTDKTISCILQMR